MDHRLLGRSPAAVELVLADASGVHRGRGEAKPGKDYATVRAFQSKLAALGHYPTAYESVDGLIDHFTQQLDKLQAKGLIRAASAAASAAGSEGSVASTRTHVGPGGVQDDDAEGARLSLPSYLQALATDLAGLRLGEIDASIDPTRQTPLQLPDIHVPLDTTFRLPAGKPLELAVAARNVGEMLPSVDDEPPRDARRNGARGIGELSAAHAAGPAGQRKKHLRRARTAGAGAMLALAAG